MELNGAAAAQRAGCRPTFSSNGRQKHRFLMVAMCGIIAMCYLASEASQNPEQQIPIAIELTQDTANIPNAQNSVLCQGKDKIIAAIGKLLVKLMAEETFWNGTVGQAKGQMATTLTQFLNIESIYRLAQATEESSIQTATYTLEKVEQLRAQKELQEKVVQQKSAAFPIEKKAINSDRELILTLIKMVESIGADNHNVTTSTKANPAAAKGSCTTSSPTSASSRPSAPTSPQTAAAARTSSPRHSASSPRSSGAARVCCSTRLRRRRCAKRRTR